jgi:hypothetical protein
MAPTLPLVRYATIALALSFSSGTTVQAAPTVEQRDCTHDNCLRALIRNGVPAQDYCAALSPTQPLPSFATPCTDYTGFISACACLPPAISTTGPTGTALPTAAPTAWQHPGVFVSKPQLDYVADKVKDNQQPWSEAFSSMLAYNLSSPTRTASPYATVECGPTSTPNIGCYFERDDSMAAYANALAWWITKSKAYADKAIYYMNAWSSILQAHTNSNAPLQAGWSAANWVRAGEIMRYSGADWADADITAFENMLRNVYIPIIINGSVTQNGNWELVMMEAAIGAAVFLEDAAIYEKAMSTFAARVPAYIYLTSDGPLPIPARGIKTDPASIIKYWNGQTIYNASGIAQETCRDFAHTSYGISSISHVAETARIQGNDLWTTALGTRIRAALELHTPFQTGTRIPMWLCNGTIGRSMDPGKISPYFPSNIFRKLWLIWAMQSLSRHTMHWRSGWVSQCRTRSSWCCGSALLRLARQSRSSLVLRR